MMAHMRAVAANPWGSRDVATRRTPDYLAEAARRTGDGRYALEHVISKAFWIQINGHWYRKSEVLPCQT